MIPRLDISFPLHRQITFWFGKAYSSHEGEYLLNHARTGIVMALRAALSNGGRVGVVAYNCHTVANAIVAAGCEPVFVDVTEDLHIDTSYLSSLQMDALIVTNLFGVRNDINLIRAAQPNAILIVDNAHGYGLPAEGDFTVYSINQGKFPSLGEGGILMVNNSEYLATIDNQYIYLPYYSKCQVVKLYMMMMIKSWMHIPIVYGLITRHLKRRRVIHYKENIKMTRMAKGVNHLYTSILPSVPQQIAKQRQNAQYIADHLINKKKATNVWYGNNAFMVIVRCDNPEQLYHYFAQYGIETSTHFAKAIEWAKHFGYVDGMCPMSEILVKELIMIPTYKKLKL